MQDILRIPIAAILTAVALIACTVQTETAPVETITAKTTPTEVLVEATDISEIVLEFSARLEPRSYKPYYDRRIGTSPESFDVCGVSDIRLLVAEPLGQTTLLINFDTLLPCELSDVITESDGLGIRSYTCSVREAANLYRCELNIGQKATVSVEEREPIRLIMKFP